MPISRAAIPAATTTTHKPINKVKGKEREDAPTLINVICSCDHQANPKLS